MYLGRKCTLLHLLRIFRLFYVAACILPVCHRSRISRHAKPKINFWSVITPVGQPKRSKSHYFVSCTKSQQNKPQAQFKVALLTQGRRIVMLWRCRYAGGRLLLFFSPSIQRPSTDSFQCNLQSCTQRSSRLVYGFVLGTFMGKGRNYCLVSSSRCKGPPQKPREAILLCQWQNSINQQNMEHVSTLWQC